VRGLFGDSQQRGGRGARLADKVNVSELLINLVTSEEPKLLETSGSNQNGTWSDSPLRIWATSLQHHRGIGRTYVSRVTCRERGKPVWSPALYGWQTDRKERC
jgi:hypothetical protein